MAKYVEATSQRSKPITAQRYRGPMILSIFVASQTGEVPTPKEEGKRLKLKQTGKTPKPIANAMMTSGPTMFHPLLFLILMMRFLLGLLHPRIPLM
jgi:hypothetical protein